MKSTFVHTWAGPLLLALACGCATQPSQRRGWYGPTSPYDDYDASSRAFTFDTHLGARMLQDGSAWDPVENQFEVGLDFQTPLLGRSRYESRTVDVLRWDLAFRWSGDQSRSEDALGVETEVDVSLYDLSGGLIVSPFTTQAPFEPYVGAGAALIWVDSEREISGVKNRETDSAFAPYVRAGARIDIGRGKHVGLDVRWVIDSDSQIDGIGGDLESVSVTFIFGASF